MADSRISIPGASLRADHGTQRRAYLAAYTPETIADHVVRPAASHEPAAVLLGDSLYLPRQAVLDLVISVVETCRRAERLADMEGAIRSAADTIAGAAALAVGRNVNLVRKGGRHA